ncbi:hypothetical protein JYU34_001214 [Plutella xylostella]|uniref:Uncharacterized protein n=1 Tax=Plutella xylostella TaxID=51655 RepID=A0ABQ7R6B1_PLUXY|nr:hypothetical protein JYU34_001214 [Plutella xylostella]
MSFKHIATSLAILGVFLIQSNASCQPSYAASTSPYVYQPSYAYPSAPAYPPTCGCNPAYQPTPQYSYEVATLAPASYAYQSVAVPASYGYQSYGYPAAPVNPPSCGCQNAPAPPPSCGCQAAPAPAPPCGCTQQPSSINLPPNLRSSGDYSLQWSDYGRAGCDYSVYLCHYPDCLCGYPDNLWVFCAGVSDYLQQGCL